MKQRILCVLLIPAIVATLMTGTALAVTQTNPNTVTQAYIIKDAVENVGIPVFSSQSTDQSSLVCYVEGGKPLNVTQVGEEWCQIYLEEYRNPKNKENYDHYSTIPVQNDPSRNNRDAGYYYVGSEYLTILPKENYVGDKSPQIETTGKTTDALHIRSTPEKKTDPSNSFGILAKGTTVQVTKRNYADGWHQIYYQNALFYVAADYVTLKGEKPDSTTITAKPTTAKVIVNGKRVNFDAYNIKDNNYFKLRDLAYVLNGNAKGFHVTYNAEKKAINLISGKPYVAVGGEMSKGNGKAKQAKLNTSTIYLNGKEVKMTAYNINDNNYFKLRDVMQALNIAVGWENVTATIIIDTTKGYVAP